MKKKVKIITLIISICIAIISFLTYGYTVIAASFGDISTSGIKQKTVSPLYDIEKGTFWEQTYNVGDYINKTNSGTGIFHKYGICLGHIYRFLNLNLEEKEDGTIVPADKGDYLLQMVIEVNPDKIEGDSIYGKVEGNDYVVIKNWNDGSPNYTTLHGGDLARIIARSVYYQDENGGYTLYPTFNEEDTTKGIISNWSVPTSYKQADLENLWKQIPQHWTNGYNIKTKGAFSGNEDEWKVYSKKVTNFKDRLWTDYYTIVNNAQGEPIEYKWGQSGNTGYKTLTQWWRLDHVGAFAMRYAIKLALKPEDNKTNGGSWGLNENQYYIAFNGETGGQKEGDLTLEGKAGDEEKRQEIVTKDSVSGEYYNKIKDLIDNNNSWNSKIDPKLTSGDTNPVFKVTDDGTFIGPYKINVEKDSKDDGAELSCEISKITVTYDDGEQETVYEYDSKNKQKNKNNVYTKSGSSVYNNVSNTDKNGNIINITNNINEQSIYFKVSRSEHIKEVKVNALGPEKYKAKILIGGYTYNNTNEQTQVTATFGDAKKDRDEVELTLQMPEFTASLEINKIDKETKKSLGGVQFILKYESGLVGEENSETAKYCKDKYITPVTKKDGTATRNYKGHDYTEYFNKDITKAKKFITSSKEGDAKGKVTISNIVRGTYRIYEVKTSSENYALLDQENIVEINDTYYRDCGTITLNQAGNTMTMEITNTQTRGDLPIQKVNENGNPIKKAGIEFKIKLVQSSDIKETEKNKWLTTTNVKGAEDTFNYSNTTNGNYKYGGYKYNSFLTETGSNAGVFSTNSEGQLNITGIPNGTYRVYETKAPEGCDLEGQKAYGEDKDGMYMAEVVIDGENIYVNGEKQPTTTVLITNTQTRGDLPILKVNQNGVPLEKVGFKLKLIQSSDIKETEKNKWVTTTNVKGAEDTFNYSNTTNGKYEYGGYKYNSFLTETESDAGVFLTNNVGKLNITGIPNGTYRVYEVETQNKDICDLAGQDGYGIDTKYPTWVYCGEIVVKGDKISFSEKENPKHSEESVAIENNTFTMKIKNKKTRTNLQIEKINKDTEKGLEGAEFKIKLETLMTENFSKLIKGNWVSNKKATSSGKYDYKEENIESLYANESEAGTFVTNADGQIIIDGILKGTYHIYETKAPKGYDLEGQEGYGKDPNYPEWVDCGIYEIPGKVTTVGNIETRGILDIEKIDSIYDELKLEGAKFKIQYVNNTAEGKEYSGFAKYENHWISNINATTSGNYNYLDIEVESILKSENKEEAGVFITNKDGQIKLEGLPCGTYHIYEVEAPKGYDITKQDNYGKDTKYPEWVDCGEAIVKPEYDDEGKAKYPTYTIENKKIVAKIEGYVWLDGPDTNKTSTTYDSLRFTYSDGLIDPGITVNLKNENGEIINSTVTDGKGYWCIDTRSNGEEFNYWDLVNAYVEFVYNNQKYVCVDTFAPRGTTEVEDSNGNKVYSVVANSKAKEYTLSKEELDDTKLTGTIGSLPGLAVTKQNAINKEMSAEEINEMRWDNSDYELEDLGLTGYYNEENYTIENINLGLWEKTEPSHEIRQSLQYSKIQINGYTYTYDYTGEKGAITDSNKVPQTLQQVGAKAYAEAIVYPSDIAYTAERKLNGMEMYVVYKINVINPTTDATSNIYDETRLYLTSLTDKFDKDRYELSTQHNGDQSWKGSEYFDLWETTNEGIANYKISEDAKLANTNGADKIDGSLSNGINAGEEKAESVYIQFKVQQSFLEDLLAGSITDDMMSSAVTEAYSTGHHSYTRTDNVWNEKESTSYYEGSKNADQNVANQNINNRKQFLHRSVDENEDSGAFCLIFRLGEERKISGTVFEDFETKESKDRNESLGNGILDEEEKANHAQNVKVELIDAAKVANKQEDTRADLYVKTSEGRRGYKVVSGNDTVVYTGEDGRYEFVGVVPGLYAIRFTYSNGNTIMIDSQGNKVDITSNDYKSTIINTDKAKDYIKNANETSIDNMIKYVNEYNGDTSNKNAQKYVEWYKYLYTETPDVNYNMATDDFTIRNNLGTYNYKENGEGTEVTNQDNSKLDKWPEVPSNTPYFSISIENEMENVGNTVDGHNPIFDGFNFGLIKTTQIIITTDKIILNVKLENQVGTALEQGDPSKTRNYITALDNLTEGSKYTRVEMAKDEIYGSTIETTYEITISNDSVKDYIEEVNTPEYGYYFKYGQKTDKAYLKTTTVIEAVDLIDEDYKLSTGDLTETVVHPEEAKGGARTDTNGKVKMDIVQNDNQPDYLSFTNWSAIEASGTSQIDYTVNGILQEDMNLSYDNSAKVVSMKLDAGATLKTAYNWGEYSTTRLMVTPDTGENRNQIYYIIAAVALVILSTGIIVIKKKILK